MSSLLPTNQTPGEELEELVYGLWSVVKEDSMASAQIGHPSSDTRTALKQLIQAHDQQRDKQLRDRLMQEMSAQRRIGTSTHGICCTCQTCKNYYRECECEFNNGVDQAIAAVEWVYGDV